MADQTDFNYEEAMHGVLETKTALQRAQASVERLEQMLSERPRSFAPLAEPAFRLRDRLIEDLGTLEARLAQASAAPEPDAGPPPATPAEAAEPSREGPLADTMNLGAQ